MSNKELSDLTQPQRDRLAFVELRALFSFVDQADAPKAAYRALEEFIDHQEAGRYKKETSAC